MRTYQQLVQALLRIGTSTDGAADEYIGTSTDGTAETDERTGTPADRSARAGAANQWSADVQ